MDNNMTAIVSVMMIGLGFLNGMLVATLLDKSEVNTLHYHLVNEKQKSAGLQARIDDLEDDLVDLMEEKDQILRSLTAIVDQSRSLPAPMEPLRRSEAASDSEDEEFECPISPDVIPTGKD